MNRCLTCILTIAFTFATAGKAFGGFITVTGDTGDGTIDVNGLPQDFSSAQLRVGTGGDNLRGLAPVFFFALPTLSPSDLLVGVQLQFAYLGLTQASIFTAPNFNADLYGLGTRSTPTILTTDYFDGTPSASGGTLLAQGFITPTTSAGTLQLSGTSFDNYIRSLYNADGTPIAAYAVFRLNADINLPVGSGQYRGYEIATADNPDSTLQPQLQMEVDAVAAPAPTGLTLLTSGLATLLLLAAYRRSTGGRVAVAS